MEFVSICGSPNPRHHQLERRAMVNAAQRVGYHQITLLGLWQQRLAVLFFLGWPPILPMMFLDSDNSALGFAVQASCPFPFRVPAAFCDRAVALLSGWS